LSGNDLLAGQAGGENSSVSVQAGQVEWVVRFQRENPVGRKARLATAAAPGFLPAAKWKLNFDEHRRSYRAGQSDFYH